MPDSERPTGVDFYILEGYQDWQTWADKGVQFAFLKERQGDWTYDPPGGANALWFSKSWQGVKDAGMLRAPYLFPMACRMTVPNVGSITAGNWQRWTIDEVNSVGGPHTDGQKSLDYVLQQTNAFCDEILSAGWGEPGDLPPAVDIESTTFFTTGGTAVPFIQSDTPEIWQRLLPADRINAIVLIVRQIENRLGVKPFIYCGQGWWEHIDAVDNGGAGYSVTHRGILYQVNHFGDYPLWCLARTTGVTGEAVIPRAWAFRPSPAESRFIWQYAKDPDRSVLVQMSASRVNPNTTNTVIATVTEIADMTYLENLAKIVKPAAARTLQLISPAPISPAPAASFNILLIGQGFSAAEFPDIAHRVWSDPAHLTSITDSAPFTDLVRASRVACYADDGTGVFLKIRQTPCKAPGYDDVLLIPPEAAGRLQAYLALLQIVGADGRTTPANQVWLPKQRLTGSTGALVVVLRNNRNPAQDPPPPAAPPVSPAQAPGELYRLDPSDNYPVPVVVVNVTRNDELWPQVVVRALAQNLGGLADEYECPGDVFDHPDDNLALPNPPNLIRMDQATRGRLPAMAAGAPVPADIAQSVVLYWRLALFSKLDFYSNGATPVVFGSAHLVEGGDGYRHNVMRSDFDCLMRRMPSPVATTLTPAPAPASIRASVPFCRVCSEWLQSVVRGGRDVRPGAIVRLDTQRIGFDWVDWKNKQQPAAFGATTPFNQALTLAVPTTEPQWSMTVTYAPNGATIGDLFQITAVQLAQRPGDPYAHAIDILRSLRFTDLSLTYVPARGAPPVTKTLDVHGAVTNMLDAPRLEIASDGGSAREFQVGAKLTLAWQIMSPGANPRMLFAIEVALGLVLSGQQRIDPRTPAIGCRILPQFAMRARRAAGLVARGGSVSSLKGSAEIEAINAIAPDPTLDPSVAGVATGHLGVSLVCESNRAGRDSVMAPITGTGLLTPASGRLLAAVNVLQPFEISVDQAPPLDWSWRYDHLRTFLTAKQKVFGAYHSDESKGKLTPVRTMNVNWPSMSPFQMELTKLPRQGSYDAIIIHPIDASATPIAGFPACGELALILPMRYGLSGGNEFGNVLGWGTGRLDQGSNSTLGAPLVPPNQHVDLTVDPIAPGQVTVTYAVTTQSVSLNEWQVFLSQGLSLSYSYGIGVLQMPWLAWVAALAGVPSARIDPLWAAARDQSHPAAFDLLVRALFRGTLHPGARMYDMTRDGSNVQQAPEAGSVPPGVEAL
jgi:hypothetical protein